LIVRLDRSKCSGHARCNALAPDVYPVDDDGYCAISEVEVAPEREQAASDGAANCPERALVVD
jgi:ferredoxin